MVWNAKGVEALLRPGLHFLTFSCYRRLPLLGTVRARNLLVKIARERGEKQRKRKVHCP